MSEGMEPAILYAAKSTEDVHGSIPTQLEDGRRLAEQEGLEVVDEYKDENASAYKGDRGPELAAALEHAERIGASLIVQHSDRLARGDGKQARHLAELFFLANRVGVTLRSVQDDSTFQNPVLAVVMGERNMEDSRRKSLAVKAGMERRRKRGLYNGGFAPYGYVHHRNEDDERVLVVDEERAPWVRRVFDLYLAGGTYAGIARALEAEGVPSPKGENLWSHFTVRKILFNPAYAGLIRGGGELLEGIHEPIVDRETWDKSVALQEAKARTHKRGRPSAGKHLFRKGFLKCGICREPMSPLTYRDRPHPTDQIYRCMGRKRHSHTCDMNNIYRSDVDDAVYAYFKDLGLDVEATREQLVAARERSLAEARNALRSAEEATQIAAERLQRIKHDYITAELSAAEWRELKAELEPELSSAQANEESLRGQLEEAESEGTLSRLTADLLGQLSEIRAEIAKEVADSMEAAAIRAALMRLFEGFVLHRGAHGPETGEGTKVAYWLEPVLSQDQMGGYVDRLKEKSLPEGSDAPPGEAKVNLDASMLPGSLAPPWIGTAGFLAADLYSRREMRVHHLNCGSFCPHGARLVEGEGGLLGRAHIVCHCLAIEAGNGIVLVDTGFGRDDARDPKRLGQPFRALMAPRPRLEETALSQLQALGFAADDVSHIVTTHLDLDHSGGLPDFPAAEVHVLASELEAALHPKLNERARYLASHWSHGPRWVEHRAEAGGEEWFGFESVRILPGLDAEVLLVPLRGHSRGHTGIAVRESERWLLHCGDSYFHRDQVQTPPGCPAVLGFYQRVLAADNDARVANAERLRELAAAHGDEVTLFCSHDRRELERERARSAGAAPAA